MTGGRLRDALELGQIPWSVTEEADPGGEDMRRRGWSRLLVVLAAMSLLATACPDDNDVVDRSARFRCCSVDNDGGIGCSPMARGSLGCRSPPQDCIARGRDLARTQFCTVRRKARISALQRSAASMLIMWPTPGMTTS
jgi:hypothetical protein